MLFKLESEYSRIDKERWRALVFDHPNGNIFQTPEMYEVYKHTKNYEPVILSVIDANDEILGILLAVIQKEYSGFLGKFTARSIILGGPLIKDNDPNILNFILKEYNKIIKRKAIYSQLRNMWEWGELRQIFVNNGYNYEHHLNIIIDLKKDKEELWKDVSTKRRNEIRRAKKEGTMFFVGGAIDCLDKCYQILKIVYGRAKLPLPDVSFFYSLLKYSNDNLGLRLFCAKYEHKIIGCMLGLVYKDIIYDFYAGADPAYYDKYPNDLIPWEVFLWGKENGYKIFDFGGAGRPDKHYGVRDYKKKFGGTLVNYGRFEKIHRPILMEIGKMGFKAWQRLK